MSMEDARDRIEEARAQLTELDIETEAWLRAYLGRMFEKANSKDPKIPHIHLPSTDENIITGRPKVLVSQIIENLRVALDYAVFALSKKNYPTLNERIPKFVIAENKLAFDRAARKGLKYLTDDERNFIEQLQPYRVKPGAMSVTGLIRDATNVSKHRNLLSIYHKSNVNIIRADQKDEYKYDEEWWRFPAQDDSIFFVKASDLRVVLFECYNLVEILPRAHMLTSVLIDIFYDHLNGNPLPDSLEKVEVRIIPS